MAKIAPPKWCAAPVGHAAAGIIGERPPTGAVDGEAAAATIGMVRGPGRGTEPHVPVHALRNRFAGQVARLRERTDVDVDRLDRAEFAAPALVDHSTVVFQHPLAAAGDDAAITPGRRDHHRAFAEGLGLGLLAIDVLAVAAGLDHHDRVPMVGRGTMDGVDIGAGQQIAEVVVGLAIAVVVLVVDAVATAVADVFARRRKRQRTARRRDRGTPLGRRNLDFRCRYRPSRSARWAPGGRRRRGPSRGSGRGRPTAVAAAALRKSRRLARCFMEVHFLS